MGKEDVRKATICVPVETNKVGDTFKDTHGVDTCSVSTDDGGDLGRSLSSTVSSEGHSKVEPRSFVSNGSTVMSSLNGRGEEHMDTKKSDVVPGMNKTGGWYSTHRCADKSQGDIPRLPCPVLRGPSQNQDVKPNFLQLHGSARVFPEPTRHHKKIFFKAPTRSQPDSHIMDSLSKISRVRSAISQWEKMPIRDGNETHNSMRWPFAVS